MTEEIRYKEKQLRDFIDKKGLMGIVLSTREFFSWITGGSVDYIIETTGIGVVDLLFTADSKYCIASKIERFRIMEEELDGLEYKLIEFDWWATSSSEIVEGIIGKESFGADTDFSGGINVYEDLKPLRYSLQPVEVERFKKSSIECAEALENTCRSIHRGMTEFEVCGTLLKNAMDRGIESTVALVASDERISKYRHPIPKDKKIDKYVLVVICGRREGLITSCTRFVHFGEPPAEIRDKHSRIVKVDAEFISNTIPGRKVSDVFKCAMEMYEEIGYKDQWKFLHQGGPAGYSIRDYHGTPTVKGVVVMNQAFAWNPSVPGTKSEDTIIAKEGGPEIISSTGNWPMVEVRAKNGMMLERPDILVL